MTIIQATYHDAILPEQKGNPLIEVNRPEFIGDQFV